MASSLVVWGENSCPGFRASYDKLNASTDRDSHNYLGKGVDCMGKVVCWGDFVLLPAISNDAETDRQPVEADLGEWRWHPETCCNCVSTGDLSRVNCKLVI